jgi:15-cis-phytoene synthase
MNIALYNQISDECNALITHRYSTSFTLGIKMLGKRFQQAIYGIYGYVRVADEIVDSFHGFDKATLLQEFERDTYLALERGISTNPVIQSFQRIVEDYKIDHELVKAFLESMKMDLEDQKYDPSLYQKYIYGSAEVVGLMCLKIFCEGNQQRYEELTPAAKSLGAAFQKVNFLRDLKDDFYERGRVYFPGLDIKTFDIESKKLIEADIQKDFDDALLGIKQLPDGSRIGVYLAYRYYIKLFKRIKRKMPEQVIEERVRINNAAKMYILARSVARYKLNLL